MNSKEKELIEGYKKLITGNFCDAMVRFGLPLGVIYGLYPISANQKMAVGFAATLKQMERHQSEKEENLTAHTKFISEDLSEGGMFVMDIGGRRDICSAGDILARIAKIKGVAGFIVNGCVRDVGGIVELGFPVHAIGTTPEKSAPHLRTIGVNITVEINGVQIRPGDLIVADQTGVVVIPRMYAEKVLEKALEIHSKEAQMINMISKGTSLADAAAKVGFYGLPKK